MQMQTQTPARAFVVPSFAEAQARAKEIAGVQAKAEVLTKGQTQDKKEQDKEKTIFKTSSDKKSTGKAPAGKAPSQHQSGSDASTENSSQLESKLKDLETKLTVASKKLGDFMRSYEEREDISFHLPRGAKEGHYRGENSTKVNAQYKKLRGVVYDFENRIKLTKEKMLSPEEKQRRFERKEESHGMHSFFQMMEDVTTPKLMELKVKFFEAYEKGDKETMSAIADRLRNTRSYTRCVRRWYKELEMIGCKEKSDGSDKKEMIRLRNLAEKSLDQRLVTSEKTQREILESVHPLTIICLPDDITGTKKVKETVGEREKYWQDFMKVKNAIPSSGDRESIKLIESATERYSEFAHKPIERSAKTSFLADVKEENSKLTRKVWSELTGSKEEMLHSSIFKIYFKKNEQGSFGWLHRLATCLFDNISVSGSLTEIMLKNFALWEFLFKDSPYLLDCYILASDPSKRLMFSDIVLDVIETCHRFSSVAPEIESQIEFLWERASLLTPYTSIALFQGIPPDVPLDSY